MTNPSETRDSELALNLRADASLLADMFGGKPPPQTGAIIDRLREAADTIDRLTSSGEAVAYRTDIFENLPNGKLTRLILDASEVKDPDPDWKPLVYASPREGHVEVPVEVLEHCLEAFRSLPEDALGYGDGGPGSDVRWPFRDELIDRVRAALPHNQGETKP